MTSLQKWPALPKPETVRLGRIGVGVGGRDVGAAVDEASGLPVGDVSGEGSEEVAGLASGVAVWPGGQVR
jgi:hypothetical protein